MASVCVICCQIYAGDRGAVPQVDKLSEALSQAKGNATSLSSGDNVKLLEKLVCGICAAAFETAIVQKEDIVSTEKRVRQLQALLLRTLGHLKAGIEEYQEQMREVDKIMKDSHGKINHLDTYFGEVGTKEELKGAVDLRTDLFSVVHELRDFGKALSPQKGPVETVESAADTRSPAPDAGNPGNGSSEEVGGQEQTPGTPRDNDEGPPEVSSNDRRPLPAIRPCSVVLQRIAVPQSAVTKHPCKSKKRRLRHRCAECTLCQRRFRHFNQLEAHFKSKHPSRKPYPCTYCGKEFPHKHNLKNHVASKHDPSLRRLCHECTPARVFASSTTLSDHRKRHHGGGPRIRMRAERKGTDRRKVVPPPPCAKCGITLTSVQERRGHRCVKCTMCGMIFKHYVELMTHHREKHGSVKAFHCRDPGCGKGFTAKCGLEYHMAHRHSNVNIMTIKQEKQE